MCKIKRYTTIEFIFAVQSHKMKFFKFLVFFLSILAFFSINSCKKDQKILKDKTAKLQFSKDTVLFDTVFTSIGSATKRLKVYNPYKEKLIISNIRLKGTAGAAYRLNIDGLSSSMATEVELAGRDSLFIFVEVTINPSSTLTPFIVEDAIEFETNGNLQQVKLVAWGQNAHYIYPDRKIEGLPDFSIIGCDTTWTDNTPHIIYGYAVVDSSCKLTIKEGTKIYFHSGAGLWIYKGGSLKVEGTKDKPVVFQGDRLDNAFADEPGQWDRIWINEGSVDNEINYAIIKNAFIGLQLETLQGNMGNQLKLSNSIIKNMTGIGIFSRFYKVNAQNVVISNCAQYTLAATLGGEHNYTHCTFANYYSKSDKPRQTPSVLLNNYNNVQSIPLSVNFENSILFGDLANELKFDSNTGAAFNLKFENCLVKADNTINTSDASVFINCLVNEDPKFKDARKNDYTLLENSPLIDKASVSIANKVPLDINEKNRLPLPDIGAIEYIP
jgi:hypothetical protein